jgi:hypothetical protein
VKTIKKINPHITWGGHQCQRQGKFVAYFRVSTDKQGRSGLGLKRRREAVLAYLNGGRWSLVEEFVEIESGKRNDRPQLSATLAACKKHKAKLVIAKLDRLSRNLAFIATLMDSGVEFVAVDNPHVWQLAFLQADARRTLGRTELPGTGRPHARGQGALHQGNRKRRRERQVRRNEPLTPTGLGELERIFLDAGVDETALTALQSDGGLPRFVRALVGLDREAAKRAFTEFLDGRRLTADQLDFLDLVIDHLTARGVMDPKLLYEPPFTDFNRNGVEGVFEHADVIRLVQIQREIEPRSAA